MSRRSVAAGLLCVAFGACAGNGPVALGDVDCIRPTISTSGWQRVTESRGCGMFCRMEISYLVPPTFERAGSYAWERNATRTEWFATDLLALPDPYPEMTHTGKCRTQISNHRTFIDYGTLGGDIMPDHLVLAYWRSVPMIGTNGDILFSARMRDPADRVLIEAMIWSVEISRGGPGG
jgi:hypothetical protein